MITSKLQSETHSHSHCKANYICFSYSNTLCPWNSCQNKGGGGAVILLSAFLCRLCPGDRTALKKEKKPKQMIHSRLQRMPYWQKLLQPQAATAPNCYSPKSATAPNYYSQKLLQPKAPLRSIICSWCLNTRPSKHQTLLQLSAGGFCVPNTHSPGINTQCVSADLDCRARQPGKVHFGLQKLWQNLCSQLELYPAEAIKSAWILVLHFYREMRIFCVWLIPPFVSWVGAAWAGALWEKSSLGKRPLSGLACLWKFGFHFSQRGCCILTTWCLLEKPGRGTL